MSRKKVVEIIIVLAAIATIIGVGWGVYVYYNPRIIANEPTATPVVPISPTAFPTTPVPVQPTIPSPVQPTPTDTPTSLPTSMPSPTMYGPLTRSENIRLQCTCSDRVVATITKIEMQPQQDRMLWTMTFFNNSQQSAYAAFGDGNFYLQEGDQVNDPASGEPTYDATGSVIGTFNSIFLQAGEQQQVIITFSFVPYTATPYTLVAIMQMDCCGQEIAHFKYVFNAF